MGNTGFVQGKYVLHIILNSSGRQLLYTVHEVLQKTVYLLYNHSWFDLLSKQKKIQKKYTALQFIVSIRIMLILSRSFSSTDGCLFKFFIKWK